MLISKEELALIRDGLKVLALNCAAQAVNCESKHKNYFVLHQLRAEELAIALEEKLDPIIPQEPVSDYYRLIPDSDTNLPADRI